MPIVYSILYTTLKHGTDAIKVDFTESSGPVEYNLIVAALISTHAGLPHHLAVTVIAGYGLGIH